MNDLLCRSVAVILTVTLSEFPYNIGTMHLLQKSLVSQSDGGVVFIENLDKGMRSRDVIMTDWSTSRLSLWCLSSV